MDFVEQALDSQGTTAIDLENAITQFEEGQEQCQKMGLSLLNALINYQSQQKKITQWFYIFILSLLDIIYVLTLVEFFLRILTF